MTSRIDAELEAYQLARAMSWNYRLAGFEAAALQPILATYDAARAEILAAFQARYATMTDWRATRAEEVLGEVEAMTAGLRQTLSDQYGAMTVTVGMASAAEAAAALSLGGLVSVNAVALSPSQLRQFFVDMPICGHKLTRWVNASFDATVQEQIRQALGVGVIRGEGTRALVKRLEDGLGMARGEATTLTRTFVAAANNAARDEVYKANDDVVKGWKWHTAGDNHVCLLCLPLHGRKFKMGEGPGLPRHPRCLTADTPVYAPDKIAAFVSTYDGPVFEIGLSDGRRFTVTANHMFLTPNGFAPAKSFRKGDDIFSGPVSNGPQIFGVPNNDGNPSRIDEIVEAFAKTCGVGSSLMPAAAEHLHGDGEFIQGDVNVIAPTSLLRGDFDAFLSEYGDKMPFPFAGELLPSALDRQRLLSLPLFWLRYATNSIVRGNSVLDVIGLRSGSHHQPVGDDTVSRGNSGVGYYPANNIARNKERFSNRIFGLAADVSFYDDFFGQGVAFGGLETCGLPIDWRDSVALENGSHTRNCDSKILGEYARRFAGRVTLANVEFVRERYFRGHVYDLQTISSMYYVNGVVSSNCRCVRLPETVSWRELGIDIDEFEAEADKWIVRGKANKDGSISVKPVGVGGANPILRISNHPDADSWWASLSAAEKKATQLGPGRAELLDAGKIKMKDLIDNDYKVRTLKDLQLLQQPSATVGFDNTLKITPSARSYLGIPDSFRPLEETLGGGDRFWDETIKKDYSRLATVGSHTIEINAKDPREVMYFGYAKGNEIMPGFSDKMLKMGDKMVTLEARAVKYGAEIEKRILAYVNTSNAYGDAHIAGDAVKAEKLRIASEKAKEAYEAVLEKNKLNHSKIEALNDKMEKSCLKFTKATKSNAWVDPLPEAKKYVDSIKINIKGAVSSEQEIKESLSGAVSLANGKGSSALSELGYTQPRAYANDVAQFMNVGQGFRQTIFHEYGHFVEFSDVSVKEAARSFVLARAESLELEKLSVLTGDATYDKAGEMAYKDKFIRHYAGKVYSDGCTEIVSMGLEYFNSAHSMVELFRKDKEHFFFTLGAVRI